VPRSPAGLLDAGRRPKDWGGCVPADVNAETVLVLDLVPAAAGADITPPDSPFTLEVHVSHHGRAAVSGNVHAAWTAPGTPAATAVAAGASSEPVKAEPFRLSPAAELTVPPVAGPARLLIWLADNEDRTIARAYLDAAEVEPPNRRGARPGEFEDAPRPGVA
jgi:hypothetical protein